MEFLPKLASTENEYMTTTSMTGRPPLQELIKTAMEGAASKIDVDLEAARQIGNRGGTPPQREKTAAAKADHLPTELIHKLAAAAHYGARQLNPKIAAIELDGESVSGFGPGEGPGALQVEPAKAEGDGVMEAGQSGHATAKNLPPTDPAQQKDPTRVADPGTGLQTNDSMEHSEQPVEPITNQKATLSNEGDKAASATYLNNLFAVGLLKTAATPRGVVFVPRNELVKQALHPAMLAAGAPAGGALYGAMQAPEGRALEGAARGAVGGVTAPVGAALGAGYGGARGAVGGGLKGAVGGGLVGGAAGGLGGAGLGALGGAALGHLTGLGAGKGALIGGGVGGIGGAMAGGLAGAQLGAPIGAVSGGLGGAYRGGLEGGEQGWDVAMGPMAKAGSAGRKQVSKVASAMAKAVSSRKPEAPKTASIYARNLMVLGLYKQAEDAINPAQISAGRADAVGPEPPHGASPSEEGVPSEPSDVQAQKRKMVSSNEAAINYTKRDAKGDPKSDVNQVLNEPALSESTDKVLSQALVHNDEAGSKISSADVTRIAGARAVLQKLAAAHIPRQKTKKSMIPGMSGGAAPSTSPSLPSTPSQSSGFRASTQS